MRNKYTSRTTAKLQTKQGRLANKILNGKATDADVAENDVILEVLKKRGGMKETGVSPSLQKQIDKHNSVEFVDLGMLPYQDLIKHENSFVHQVHQIESGKYRDINNNTIYVYLIIHNKTGKLVGSVSIDHKVTSTHKSDDTEAKRLVYQVVKGKKVFEQGGAVEKATNEKGYIILNSPIHGDANDKNGYRAVVQVDEKEKLSSVLIIERDFEKTGRWGGTPGRWYIGTLLNKGGYYGATGGVDDEICIDGGSKWNVFGMRAAIKEAEQLLGVYKNGGATAVADTIPLRKWKEIKVGDVVRYSHSWAYVIAKNDRSITILQFWQYGFSHDIGRFKESTLTEQWFNQYSAVERDKDIYRIGYPSDIERVVKSAKWGNDHDFFSDNDNKIALVEKYKDYPEIKYIFQEMKKHGGIRYLDAKKVEEILGTEPSTYRKGGEVQFKDIEARDNADKHLFDEYEKMKEECLIKTNEAYGKAISGSKSVQEEFNAALTKHIQNHFNLTTQYGGTGSSVYYNYSSPTGKRINEVIILSPTFYGGGEAMRGQPSIILFGGKIKPQRVDIRLNGLDTPSDVIKKILIYKDHIVKYAGKEILTNNTQTMKDGGEVKQSYWYAVADKGMASWDSLPQTEIPNSTWSNAVKVVKMIAHAKQSQVRLSKSTGFNNQGHYFHHQDKMENGGALPYSQRLWTVTETKKSDNTVVREEKNLNTYQAEEMYGKLANTNPVRQGINNVKMTETTKFKSGGAIENQYAGKHDKQVWNEWTHDQRLHFIQDHFEGNETEQLRKYIDWTWEDIRDDETNGGAGWRFFNFLKGHVQKGEYKKGGNVPKVEEPTTLSGYLQTINADLLPDAASTYLRDELLSDSNLDLLSLSDTDVQAMTALIAEKYSEALPKTEVEVEIPAYEPEPEPVHVPTAEIVAMMKEADDVIALLEIVDDKKELNKFTKELNDVISVIEMDDEIAANQLKTKHADLLAKKYKKGGAIGELDDTLSRSGWIHNFGKYSLAAAKKICDKKRKENNNFEYAVIQSDINGVLQKDTYSVIERDKNYEPQAAKTYYKDGGAVDGKKKYLFKSYDCDLTKTTYDEGDEMTRSHSFDVKVGKTYNSKQELIAALNKEMYVDGYTEHDFDWETGEGRNIQTDVLVSIDKQGDFFKATEKEVEAWKKGEKELFNAHYFFYVTPITELDEYGKGGGIFDASNPTGSEFEKGGKIMGVDNKAKIKKSDEDNSKWVFTITWADEIDGKKVWRTYPNYVSELFDTQEQAENGLSEKHAKMKQGGSVERGKFNTDTDTWGDELVDFAQSSDQHDMEWDVLIALSKKEATKANFKSFMETIKEYESLTPSLKEKILKQCSRIFGNKYKSEFKHQFGGKGGDVSKVSQASAFFYAFRQAAEYGKMGYKKGGAVENDSDNEKYEVIVGNIGTVLRTNDLAEANKVYAEYIEASKAPHGKAAGDDVHLLEEGEPIKDFFGSLHSNDDMNDDDVADAWTMDISDVENELSDLQHSMSDIEAMSDDDKRQTLQDFFDVSYKKGGAVVKDENLKEFEIFKNGTQQGTVWAKTQKEAEQKVWDTYGEHREVYEVEESEYKKGGKVDKGENLKEFEIFKNGTQQGTVWAKTQKEAEKKVWDTYGEHRKVYEVEESEYKKGGAVGKKPKGKFRKQFNKLQNRATAHTK